MRLSVFVCGESDTVRACARIMRDRTVGLLPVIDVDERVVGVVTDRDLSVRVLAAGLADDTPVRSVMTRDVISCCPDTPLREAETLMISSGRSRLVVTDPAGRCAGVLSLSDIARAENERRSGEVLRAVTSRR